MEATIVNFRMGRHHTTGNQAVISVPSVSSKEDAAKLVGKTVTYTCEGKDKKVITGKVSAAHGNSGAVRALFEKGLPGQAIGKHVRIE
jgi:large subunit ribosomal protein L35Ae